MSDQSRSFPDRPSLRFLKLEARRRLAAGEFPNLHDAQLAIAREHGLSSWTALKQFVSENQPDPSGPSGPEGSGLGHVRWVVSRFAAVGVGGSGSGSGGQAWMPPGEDELREHFDESFLSRITADRLVRSLASSARAGRLRDELTVSLDRPRAVRAQAGGVLIHASVATEPPYRLTALRVFRVSDSITDARVSAPPTDTSGEVPAVAAAVAEEVFGEFGLPGLALAAGGGGGAPWALARGWADLGTADPDGADPDAADLDGAEPLRTGHRFPVYTITMLITAVAVLRLVADGRVDLDGPANDHLRTVRLADDAVTVRELLSHTDSVDRPTPPFAETARDLVDLTGPAMTCSGTRGTFGRGGGGYAALGQLIADVTGSSYPDAAARLVLGPLGMSRSWFPARWPQAGSDAVTGYELAPDGSFTPAPREVAAVPAVLGLWATAGDLVRFGVGWSSLLPPELAREALRPQVRPHDLPAGAVGLGWFINESLGLAGSPGAHRGGSASLVMRLETGQVHAAMTSRHIPIEPVNGRVIRAINGHIPNGPDD
jgi:CubicO group peptidase (beta-lactamase class C family)